MYQVACGDCSDLAALVPAVVPGRDSVRDERSIIPALAKQPDIVREIEAAIRRVRTTHQLMLGDSRRLTMVADESVHLVVTSPPYWTLKHYSDRADQLGSIESYDAFLDELDTVWREMFRVLVPGGRLVIVVGDVCLSRRRHGRHIVVPLHASIQERCRAIGFENLAPIIWSKIGNARLEVEGRGSFLGKPYEPNAIIKNDIEYILFQRKPGGYRQPTWAARVLSIIPRDAHRSWFQQIWSIPGASSSNHPAPYPIALVERLVRMFSFVGDTVLDPFMGSGTTNIAAARWGRHSIGIDVEPAYVALATSRLERDLRLRYGSLSRQGRAGSDRASSEPAR
jgi:DNA modification methylase